MPLRLKKMKKAKKGGACLPNPSTLPGRRRRTARMSPVWATFYPKCKTTLKTAGDILQCKGLGFNSQNH